LRGDRHRGPRLLEADVILQSRDRPQPMLFSCQPARLPNEVRPGRQRNPEVRRDFRIETGKVPGRDARNRERAIVQDDCLADDVGIGVEVPGPESIAQ